MFNSRSLIRTGPVREIRGYFELRGSVILSSTPSALATDGMPMPSARRWTSHFLLVLLMRAPPSVE